MVDARDVKRSLPVVICAFAVTSAVMIGFAQETVATPAEGRAMAVKTVSLTPQDDIREKVVDFGRKSTFSAVPKSLLMRIENDSKATSKSGFRLDFAHATTNKYQGHVIARVPLVGENVLTSHSAVTIAYDARTMKTVAAQETVLARVTPTSANIKMWQGGSLARDVYLDAAGHTISRAQAESTKPNSSGVQTIGFDFGAFNDCLSSQGIAAWTIVLISIGCSLACGATLGAGCIACLLAISAISGGIIGYCAGVATV